MKKRSTLTAAAVAAVFLLCSSLSFAGAAEMTELKVTELVPIGRAVGIEMSAKGALIVSYSDANGDSAAKKGGLRPGDLIVSVDGREVSSARELTDEIAKSGCRTLSIEVLRNGRSRSFKVTPTSGPDGLPRIGAWVRDSLAGIGTVTFYDPQSGVIGLLGHGISDGESGVLMPVDSGSLMPARVSGVKKSRPGCPGELTAVFGTPAAGELVSNSETGLFGHVAADELYPELFSADPIPVATMDQVKTGSAYILANVEGEEVRQYQIEISAILDRNSATRNFRIRITDSELAEITGGIVQGMSGSPIIQNGRIVGAVTHVLVDSPTDGYGIFIGNMLSHAAENRPLPNAA